MKGGKFSCASPSCLAVCTSIHQRSTVRPAIVAKANLRDPRKTKPLKPLPKPPSNPKKSRKSSEYSTSTGSSSIITEDPISPANSSRCLLNDSAFSDIFPDLEPELESNEPCLVPKNVEMQRSNRDEPSTVILSSSSSSKNLDQVVALRVSLHCKGCEGKVRKHISKMEGVTSFDIDFAAKKVTVMGNVTPLGVLTSVLKVKSAEFWPSPPSVSISSF